MPGPRSGNYEVDDEGNLVEVGAAGQEGAGVEGGPGAVPDAVRKAVRYYDLATFVAFVILVAMAIGMAEVRGILLVLAVAYLLVAIGMRRTYRRALTRAGSKR